ncbi:MAG: hypothetical protein ACLUYZ_08455 [Lachnospiraceae bacterium]
MTETIFEKLAAAVATLKLDFSSEEFALYAEEHELSELEMAAVENVFTYLSEKNSKPRYTLCSGSAVCLPKRPGHLKTSTSHYSREGM